MMKFTPNIISLIHDIMIYGVWDNMRVMDNVSNNISHLKGINIVFQHPVALVNDLICRVSFEGTASCCVCRLVVCHAVMYYRCYFYNIFDLVRSSSGRYFCELLHCIAFFSSLF
jgi:hypothetical protein